MADRHDPPSPPARFANGRFAAGNSGKPPGATNLSTRLAARAFLADFETHRGEFLTNLREQFPVEYIRAITRILPKDVAESPIPVHDWSATAVSKAHADVKRLLGVETDPRVALAGVEAILSRFRAGEA